MQVKSYYFLLVCYFSVRPSMPETTALGAAMAAGCAEEINVWNLDPSKAPKTITDTFVPSIPAKGELFSPFYLSVIILCHLIKYQHSLFMTVLLKLFHHY